jgi:dTDP-4-dehydrorhamnose 3,5-epimerase
MKITETTFKGAFLIDIEPMGDERGFFARAFCKNELGKAGLFPDIVQINNSVSRYRGTLRGMHYQLAPNAEDKIVRCIKGSLFDAIIDLREGSETFGQWYGTELTAENRRMLFVPKGFAHGILTLEDNTEIFYLVTAFYSKESERGIRWDDPEFNIRWPIDPVIISDKDKNHPLFNPSYHLK